ncbi:uncharacterized protein LOC134204616 isoform X2 [Armigeres subalbatus]
MTDFCDYRIQCLKNDKRIASHRQRKIEPECSATATSPEELQDVEEFIEYEVSITNDEDAAELMEDDVDNTSEYGHEVTIDGTSNVKEEQTFDDDHLIPLEQESDPPDDAADVSDVNQPEKSKKKRTRKILLHEGHTYQLLSSRPKCDSITWGCFWRKTKGCRGTLGTRVNGMILGNVIPQHNHPAQPVDRTKQRKAIVIHAFREVENVYLNEPYEIVKNRIGGDMLVYNGDRYPYSHSRKDGCRIWKCNSHRKCTVSIYLCPDGRIFKQANSRHSDDKIIQKRIRQYDDEVDVTISDASATIEEIYPNPEGTFNYKIVKNTNKRNVLIYEGDRYSYYYKKTNGWIVWRCTVSKGCVAMIYQLCDESVAVLGDTTHNHLKISGSSQIS